MRGRDVGSHSCTDKPYTQRTLGISPEASLQKFENVLLEHLLPKFSLVAIILDISFRLRWMRPVSWSDVKLVDLPRGIPLSVALIPPWLGKCSLGRG
jgi:hypothetical protein